MRERAAAPLQRANGPIRFALLVAQRRQLLRVAQQRQDGLRAVPDVDTCTAAARSSASRSAWPGAGACPPCFERRPGAGARRTRARTQQRRRSSGTCARLCRRRCLAPRSDTCEALPERSASRRRASQPRASRAWPATPAPPALCTSSATTAGAREAGCSALQRWAPSWPPHSSRRPARAAARRWGPMRRSRAWRRAPCARRSYTAAGGRDAARADSQAPTPAPGWTTPAQAAWRPGAGACAMEVPALVGRCVDDVRRTTGRTTSEETRPAQATADCRAEEQMLAWIGSSGVLGVCTAQACSLSSHRCPHLCALCACSAAMRAAMCGRKWPA